MFICSSFDITKQKKAAQKYNGILTHMMLERDNTVREVGERDMGERMRARLKQSKNINNV